MEEQEEKLLEAQNELDLELERRMELVNSTGAKAERMEMDHAEVCTRLSIVYARAMELEDEAAELEAAIAALDAEIGENQATRAGVEEQHRGLMKSMYDQ